jgi:polysaccharide biosynthesis protein PelG
VGCALALERGAGLGGPGYVAGFAAGQLVALGFLSAGTFQALPAEEDESERILPAFRTYWMLAASALTYHVAIWVDKLGVWIMQGATTAGTYTTAAAFAWLSVIPAFAWIYVQVETVFYQRYRLFYDGVEGGATLDELRSWAVGITAEARRIVRSAALIQLLVSSVALAAAPLLMNKARLGEELVSTFRWLLLGSALLVITLLGLLLLSYFDRRREAMVVSIVLLVGNLALPIGAAALGLPPAVGYVLGCGIACGLVLALVRRRLDSLLVDTFQSQPFGMT